jgi:hypothetical protein
MVSRRRAGPRFPGGAYASRVTDARRALLGELIDHAPLFPPASLPLEEALEDHRRARESRHAWMVRRFVAPASRFDDLPRDGLRVALVVDAPVDPYDERVEAVEGRGDPAVLARLCAEAYVEIAPSNSLLLGEIKKVGARAKVRCGGESVPSVGELAEFTRACREAGVAFKATAGLHHAVRTDSEHGFLNLLAAVVFGDEEEALAEADENAFRLDEERFGWRDREARVDELVAARERLSGIGSCSFSEPVEELERLRML